MKVVFIRGVAAPKMNTTREIWGEVHVIFDHVAIFKNGNATKECISKMERAIQTSSLGYYYIIEG